MQMWCTSAAVLEKLSFLLLLVHHVSVGDALNREMNIFPLSQSTQLTSGSTIFISYDEGDEKRYHIDVAQGDLDVIFNGYRVDTESMEIDLYFGVDYEPTTTHYDQICTENTFNSYDSSNEQLDCRVSGRLLAGKSVLNILFVGGSDGSSNSYTGKTVYLTAAHSPYGLKAMNELVSGQSVYFKYGEFETYLFYMNVTSDYQDIIIEGLRNDTASMEVMVYFGFDFIPTTTMSNMSCSENTYNTYGSSFEQLDCRVPGRALEGYQVLYILLAGDQDGSTNEYYGKSIILTARYSPYGLKAMNELVSGQSVYFKYAEYQTYLFYMNVTSDYQDIIIEGLRNDTASMEVMVYFGFDFIPTTTMSNMSCSENTYNTYGSSSEQLNCRVPGRALEGYQVLYILLAGDQDGSTNEYYGKSIILTARYSPYGLKAMNELVSGQSVYFKYAEYQTYLFYMNVTSDYQDIIIEGLRNDTASMEVMVYFGFDFIPTTTMSNMSCSENTYNTYGSSSEQLNCRVPGRALEGYQVLYILLAGDQDGSTNEYYGKSIILTARYSPYGLKATNILTLGKSFLFGYAEFQTYHFHYKIPENNFTDVTLSFSSAQSMKLTLTVWTDDTYTVSRNSYSISDTTWWIYFSACGTHSGQKGIWLTLDGASDGSSNTYFERTTTLSFESNGQECIVLDDDVSSYSDTISLLGAQHVTLRHHAGTPLVHAVSADSEVYMATGLGYTPTTSLYNTRATLSAGTEFSMGCHLYDRDDAVTNMTSILYLKSPVLSTEKLRLDVTHQTFNCRNSLPWSSINASMNGYLSPSDFVYLFTTTPEACDSNFTCKHVLNFHSITGLLDIYISIDEDSVSMQFNNVSTVESAGLFSVDILGPARVVSVMLMSSPSSVGLSQFEVLSTTAYACPSNCNGNGICDELNGVCKCNFDYSGVSCDEFKCDSVDCNSQGVCYGGSCFCVDGFEGSNCEILSVNECPFDCYGNGICLEGTCNCTHGWTGDYCESRTCSENCDPGICNAQGVCECPSMHTFVADVGCEANCDTSVPSTTPSTPPSPSPTSFNAVHSSGETGIMDGPVLIIIVVVGVFAVLLLGLVYWFCAKSGRQLSKGDSGEIVKGVELRHADSTCSQNNLI